MLSQHFRCILMDLPNFSKTGPIVYNEGVHAVQARTAVALLDALGIHHAHTWSPEFITARRQSVSLPHDYAPELAGIKAPVLLIHGRYDRMVPFEVSIAILNHIADSRMVLLNNCGHWPPFEKPAEWAAQVLAFLVGYESRQSS